MKTNELFAVLTTALLSTGAAFGAEQDIITKSFNVSPGGALQMKVDRGSINIKSSSSDKVDVEVVRELRRGSTAQAKEMFQTHKIEMSQSGDTVQVVADNPPRKLGFFKNPFNNLQVQYNISVPRKFDLDLRTAGGNIDINDLQGQVKVHTSGGNLNLGSITGPVDGHTSGGNIVVKHGKGNTNVRTSGGDLRIGEIEGDLVARTSGGNISLERVSGAVHAQTSGGDIRVKEAHGPVLARTSGGNVSARLLEQPTGDCELRTSGGNVEVTLANSLAVDVNARTSGGSIRTDFPGEMNKQRTSLVAQVNGGGPDLVLETSGGNVSIRKE